MKSLNKKGSNYMNNKTVLTRNKMAVDLGVCWRTTCKLVVIYDLQNPDGSYSRSKFRKLKNKMYMWNKQHVSSSEVSKLLGFNISHIKNIFKRTNTPIYGNTAFIKRSDLKKYMDNNGLVRNSNGGVDRLYYSLKEAMSILNIGEMTVRRLVKEGTLTNLVKRRNGTGDGFGLSKDQVNYYRDLQITIENKWIRSRDVYEQYGIKKYRLYGAIVSYIPSPIIKEIMYFRKGIVNLFNVKRIDL